MNFDTIKRNYDRGLWNITLVRMAVRQGFITASQFEQITGEAY